MDEKFKEDSYRFFGKVESWMDNTTDHLKAVSQKANEIRDQLNDHERDAEAHGMGAAGKATGNIWTVLALVVAAVSLGLSFLNAK